MESFGDCVVLRKAPHADIRILCFAELIERTNDKADDMKAAGHNFVIEENSLLVSFRAGAENRTKMD